MKYKISNAPNFPGALSDIVIGALRVEYFFIFVGLKCEFSFNKCLGKFALCV